MALKEDLLRLLRVDSEFRDTARREILTEELLGLPARFAALAAAQQRTEEQLAALTARVQTLTARVETLAAQVQRLAGVQEGMLLELRGLSDWRRGDEGRRAGERYERDTIRHAYALFGGGRAGLTLIDENDPLESGIDIVASPPGKRLQNVQLLSGGEKALTAIALMFAIFEYKPSPFCLLDEIDAPLDDANVGRFVEMLRGMLDRTQFILITHNRRTMEIANRLYGVTMEEAGVSHVLTLSLEEAEELARKVRASDERDGNGARTAARRWASAACFERLCGPSALSIPSSLTIPGIPAKPWPLTSWWKRTARPR